jgi:hypothetical protein
MSLNFGTLMEILEDWIRNDLTANRIIARIVDGEKAIETTIGGAYFVESHKTIYLVIRRPGEEDLLDDDGNLLNDETPNGIYVDLLGLEELGIDYSTPIEIEIWFSDGEDDIQYRLESHQYYINNNKLTIIHLLGDEKDEYEDEFRNFLLGQY